MVILHVMIREFLCNGYAMVMVGYVYVVLGYVVGNFGSGYDYQVVGYGVLVYGCAVVVFGGLCADGYSYTKETKRHVVKGEKGYIKEEKIQHINTRKGQVVKAEKDDILQEKRHHMMKEKQQWPASLWWKYSMKSDDIIVICERIQALFNSSYLANQHYTKLRPSILVQCKDRYQSLLLYKNILLQESASRSLV